VAYRLSHEACVFLDCTDGVDRGLYGRIAIEVVTDERVATCR
jgi:hypothetical protein